MKTHPGRKPNPLLSDPNYKPEVALNWMKKAAGVATDNALAIILKIERNRICAIRYKRQPIGDSILIKLHELTNMHIRDIRRLMGIA